MRRTNEEKRRCVRLLRCASAPQEREQEHEEWSLTGLNSESIGSLSGSLISLGWPDLFYCDWQIKTITEATPIELWAWFPQTQGMQRKSFVHFLTQEKQPKQVHNERNEHKKVYATDARNAADANNATQWWNQCLFLRCERCVGWKPGFKSLSDTWHIFVLQSSISTCFDLLCIYCTTRCTTSCPVFFNVFKVLFKVFRFFMFLGFYGFVKIILNFF